MELTVATIQMSGSVDDPVWVYVARTIVFDRKQCKNRAEAVRWIHAAHPDSDIRTLPAVA